jgi:hypothetical protein
MDVRARAATLFGTSLVKLKVACIRFRPTSSQLLGRFAYKESQVDCNEANRINSQVECSRPEGLPNKRLHPTGWSLLLIENLSHDAVVSRRVNRGVRCLS